MSKMSSSVLLALVVAICQRHLVLNVEAVRASISASADIPVAPVARSAATDVLGGLTGGLSNALTGTFANTLTGGLANPLNPINGALDGFNSMIGGLTSAGGQLTSSLLLPVSPLLQAANPLNTVKSTALADTASLAVPTLVDSLTRPLTSTVGSLLAPVGGLISPLTGGAVNLGGGLGYGIGGGLLGGLGGGLSGGLSYSLTNPLGLDLHKTLSSLNGLATGVAAGARLGGVEKSINAASTPALDALATPVPGRLAAGSSLINTAPVRALEYAAPVGNSVYNGAFNSNYGNYNGIVGAGAAERYRALDNAALVTGAAANRPFAGGLYTQEAFGGYGGFPGAGYGYGYGAGPIVGPYGGGYGGYGNNFAAQQAAIGAELSAGLAGPFGGSFGGANIYERAAIGGGLNGFGGAGLGAYGAAAPAAAIANNIVKREAIASTALPEVVGLGYRAGVGLGAAGALAGAELGAGLGINNIGGATTTRVTETIGTPSVTTTTTTATTPVSTFTDTLGATAGAELNAVNTLAPATTTTTSALTYNNNIATRPVLGAFEGFGPQIGLYAAGLPIQNELIANRQVANEVVAEAVGVPNSFGYGYGPVRDLAVAAPFEAVNNIASPTGAYLSQGAAFGAAPIGGFNGAGIANPVAPIETVTSTIASPGVDYLAARAPLAAAAAGYPAGLAAERVATDIAVSQAAPVANAVARESVALASQAPLNTMATTVTNIYTPPRTELITETLPVAPIANEVGFGAEVPTPILNNAAGARPDAWLHVTLVNYFDIPLRALPYGPYNRAPWVQRLPLAGQTTAGAINEMAAIEGGAALGAAGFLPGAATNVGVQENLAMGNVGPYNNLGFSNGVGGSMATGAIAV